MTITEFAKTIKTELKNKSILSDDCTVTIHEEMKNDGTCSTGIIIRENNSNIAPVICIDDLYASYQDGMPIDSIYSFILADYRNNKNKIHFYTDIIVDFNIAKNCIGYKLVNAEKNKEYLKDIPSIPYLDLAIVFYIVACDTCDGTGTIMITNDIMAKWGVTAETLCEHALKNMPCMFKGEICSVDVKVQDEIDPDELNAMHAITSEEYHDMMETLYDETPLYVMSNNRKINGASAMLYPQALKSFAELMDSDFYIIPSSIHEVIRYACTEGNDGLSIESMREMLHELNTEGVSADEVLSDNIYFYSQKHDGIAIAK